MKTEVCCDVTSLQLLIGYLLGW